MLVGAGARRRRGASRSRAADAVRRRDRRHRRRSGGGRADAGVRQGPGRLLVLLHVLHHPGGAGAGAEPLPGDRAAGRPTRAPRGPSRDRPDRDQHRNVRRRLVGARVPRRPHPIRADAGRARPADPRRDDGGADPALVDRAAARRRRAPPGLVRRRAADDAAPPPAAPVAATTACSGGWAGATCSADYAAVVERVRAAIPGVAIHGDVIVGFPTEDDAAWRRSLAFIRSIGFAGLHVFRYSARPGTPAIRMAGQVDEPTKKRRAAELLAVAADARARWAASHVGAEARRPVRRRGWTTGGGSATPRTTRSWPPSLSGRRRPRERDRPRPHRVGRPRSRAIASSAGSSPSPAPHRRRTAVRSDRMAADPDCLFCKIVAGENPVDEGPRGRPRRRVPRHRAARPDPHPRHSARPHRVRRRPDRGRRADARPAVRDRRRDRARARASPTPATGSSPTSAAGAARPSTISTSTCSAAARSSGRPG